MPAIPPTGVDAPPPPIGDHLARARKAQQLSLAALASRSGVSKSMIAEVEKGTVNPTLVVLWKLAHALGIPINAFLEGGGRDDSSTPAILVLDERNTPVLGGPEAGYTLQILSPVESADRAELYLLHLFKGGIMDSPAHEAGACETLTVLRGAIRIEVEGSEPVVLKESQTARYRADKPHRLAAAGAAAKAHLAVQFREILWRKPAS